MQAREPAMADPVPQLSVGNRVQIPHPWRERRQCYETVEGVVRYVGPVQDKDGDNWVGIGLDKPVGLHDGFTLGHRYFTTAPNHGVFLDRKHVKKLPQPSAGELQTLQAKCLRGVPIGEHPDSWMVHQGAALNGECTYCGKLTDGACPGLGWHQPGLLTSADVRLIHTSAGHRETSCPGVWDPPRFCGATVRLCAECAETHGACTTCRDWAREWAE